MKFELSILFFVTIVSATPFYSQSLPDGVYRIVSACNNDYVIDLSASKIANGNNIQLWDNNGTDAQKWKVTHEGDAIVIRSAIDQDYVIDLYNSKTTNGQNINLWKYNGSNAQRWIPEYRKGYFILRSKINQTFTIDLNNSMTQRGTNIQCWEYNGTNAQLWDFQLIEQFAQPILSLVKGTLSFVDSSYNNRIDANEHCSIKFKIKNTGKDVAKNCEVRVKLSGTTAGISTKTIKLPTINAGEFLLVSIPITSNANTQDGQVTFSIEVYEPNGWGMEPFDLNVTTKAFEAPLLQVTKFKISTPSGKVHRMEYATLLFDVQNIKYGNAENVHIKVILPDNIAVIDGESDLSFPMIKPGEIKSSQLDFVVNKNYVESTIPIMIDVKEKYGKYAESKNIEVELAVSTSSVTNITAKEEKTTYKIVSVKDNVLIIKEKPNINILQNTSVAILRPVWFNKYNTPQNVKSPFPYAAIKLELNGDKEAIEIAKERLSLTMGGKHIVEAKDSKETNTIWFLVHCRNEYIDLDCGDGCEPIYIWKERLEPNKVYHGGVSISVE